jgi:hypothetical protein
VIVQNHVFCEIKKLFFMPILEIEWLEPYPADLHPNGV